MKLTRGLLFGFTAATLFSQDFPDKVQIDRAVQEAKRAQQEILAHKDEIAHGIQIAKRAWNVDEMKWAAKDLLIDAPHVMTMAKEMSMDHAFAMQKPFFQFERGGGGPLSDDEQLKILAIDGLMQSDSERAIPVVDKLLQNPQASTRLRMRALQALGNSNSTRARDILVRIAKDGSNPELQSRALQFLGSRDSAQNRQLLSEVYASASNVEIKRQILRSWAGMGAKDQILGVAKSDSNPELRVHAINQLGGMRATAELSGLYASESSVEVRERLIRAFAGSGEWQKLLEIAKSEKNEELRNRAIQQAGSMRNSGATEALVQMYGSASDQSTRGAILRALSNQRSAKELIALARKETNPDLKRTALQHLSHMKGEEVTTYLMELLDK